MFDEALELRPALTGHLDGPTFEVLVVGVLGGFQNEAGDGADGCVTGAATDESASVAVVVVKGGINAGADSSGAAVESDTTA